MTEWFEGKVHANGITIHYHRTGGKNKPSLLLLHGITDNGLCWSRVARDLEGSYDVIMTDARGHGRSDDIATGYSLTLLADDAAGVIQALGLEKPFLFGHSMGAMTAAKVAATYPDLVCAIILEDPPLEASPPEATNADPQAQQAWRSIFDTTLPREERIARAFAMNPIWVEEEIIPWADSKAEFRPDVMTSAAGLFETPWREIISRITCPILLITGDAERGAMVRSEVAQEASHLWHHGKLIHINGAGHNIHRDRYDKTMTAVRTFLESQ
jgi:pimeloyl-ACP methyl ester carboxylesterase